MMIQQLGVIDEQGNEYSVKVIFSFRIEELGKEYMVYTVNDDGTTETEPVYIVEVCEENGQAKVKYIPENEKNLVLTFYDHIRDSIAKAE